MQIGKLLLDALDRVGFGGIVIDTDGAVSLSNGSADRLIEPSAAAANGGSGTSRHRDAIKALLRSSGSKRFNHLNEPWVRVPGERDGERGLVLHAHPITPAPAEGPHTVLIIIDLDDRPSPSAEVLRILFELSPAEARLAHHLVSGRSLEEAADASGLKLATVRKQLASVFTKTSTHRQGELVALLGRLSILP